MGKQADLKDFRSSVRAVLSADLATCIRAIDKQAGAIAKLSEDLREAFAHHKSMIDALRDRIAELERANLPH